MVERIGYPESILNDTELDRMYEKVSSSGQFIASISSVSAMLHDCCPPAVPCLIILIAMSLISGVDL